VFFDTSVLQFEPVEVVDNCGEDCVRESRERHFKGGYISSINIWVEANEWSDINVSNVREAHIEIIFCSDSLVGCKSIKRLKAG
jgi:hypothetical protein